MLAFIEHNVPTCFTSPCSFVSFFSAHDNDVKEANKSKSSPSASQSLQPQAHVPLSHATPSLQRQPSSQQLLLQARSYPQLSRTRRRYPSCTCWPTARPWDRWALGNICSPTKPVCFRPRFRPALSRLSPAWRRGCEACLSRVPSPCRWAWAQSATASVWLTGAATWVPTTRLQPAASTGDARRGRTNSTWGCRRPPPSLPPPEGLRLGHRRRLSKQKTNSRADPTEVIVLTWELSFFSVWVFMNWGCLFFKIIKPSEDLLPVPQAYDLGIIF